MDCSSTTLLQIIGYVAMKICVKMRPKLCLSDGLNTNRHGTVKFGDQTASAAVLTADGSLRSDSCRRHLDSCTGLVDNLSG
jgi:hypothetical protein